MWNIKITTVWFPDKLNFVSSEYKISSPPPLKSSKDNWQESKHNPVNHIRRDDGACGQAAESTPTYICCWRNGTKAHAGVHCWADLNMVGSVVSWSYWAHCLTELSCWRTAPPPPPLICVSVYMCLCIKLFFFFSFPYWWTSLQPEKAARWGLRCSPHLHQCFWASTICGTPMYIGTVLVGLVGIGTYLQPCYWMILGTGSSKPCFTLAYLPL